MDGKKRRKRGDIVDGGRVRQYARYGTIPYQVLRLRYDCVFTGTPGPFQVGYIADIREPRSKITR